MWLRCCCCCCCCGGGGRKDEDGAVDDSSSLIAQEPPFCVPRRHSSFQPSIPSTHPAESPPSDGSSDEEATPGERRRCWSTTLPDPDLQEFGRRATQRDRRLSESSEAAGRFVFDRYALSQIAEEPQEAPEEDEVYGFLAFSSRLQEQRLCVYLRQAEGLPRRGDEEYATFVRMSLSAAPKTCRLSARSSGAVYQEEHSFQTGRWKSAPFLRLSVFDSDRQGRHDAIGHALLPLDDVGPEEKEYRLPLTPLSVPVRNLGQILVGLQYTPTESRLAVHVIKGRHLRLDAHVHKRLLRPAARDAVSTFCKVTLTCGGRKVKTCRSRGGSGPHPSYDFRASFVVPPRYIRDAGALVSVVASSALRRDAVLGRASPLGPYEERGDGSATQWGRMIREGRSVVQWRTLYL